jgi:excisionase family DNA binding protein
LSYPIKYKRVFLAEEPLISINEASQMLGVSEATLRQWTDEGKVKAFVTPGGHRRFTRNELRKFMSFHQKTLGIKDLVVELEDTAHLHREIAQTSLESTPWYNHISEEAQEHLGELGRFMLNTVDWTGAGGNSGSTGVAPYRFRRGLYPAP